MTFLFRLDVSARRGRGSEGFSHSVHLYPHAQAKPCENTSSCVIFFFVYNPTLMAQDLSTCYLLFSGMICFSLTSAFSERWTGSEGGGGAGGADSWEEGG